MMNILYPILPYLTLRNVSAAVALRDTYIGLDAAVVRIK